MNLSTQLRIILLLVGAAIWLAIYLLGRRKVAQTAVAPVAAELAPVREATPGFLPAEDVEDEFETPAYLRRQGPREPRQDYEPRIASAHDYVNMDDLDHDDQRFTAGEPELLSVPVHDAQDFAEPVHARAAFDEPMFTDPAEHAEVEVHVDRVSGRREPTINFDESAQDEPIVADRIGVAATTHIEAAEHATATEAFPAEIPVVEHPVAGAAVTSASNYVQRAEAKPGPTAPTLSEAVSAPVAPAAPPAQQSSAAPAKAEAGKSSGSPARRKIIALRVPMPERVPGAQLLSLLQGERLQHGKFNIFHRLHDAGTVFSVASMVEPGSFDLHAMSEQQFSGVTLFMLLPGPLDGLVAYDQMLSCAQRIAHTTHGVLQDERGSKLTPQIIDKLRDEVLDFQHLLGAASLG